MSLTGNVCLDATSIGIEMEEITNLLNIIVDDLEANGEYEPRRELTISSLHIIRNYLAVLAEQQDELVDRLMGGKKEAKS